jgi:hypothetical protein
VISINCRRSGLLVLRRYAANSPHTAPRMRRKLSKTDMLPRQKRLRRFTLAQISSRG